MLGVITKIKNTALKSMRKLRLNNLKNMEVKEGNLVTDENKITNISKKYL